MAERLGIVRLAPTSILDAGCGTGEALGELHARYPGAGLLGIDFAFRMISAARARAPARSEHARSLLARLAGSYRDPPIARPQFVCGDLIRLPMQIPHGIFNKSDQAVKCFFWVSPTRRLYDLFWAIHSMKEQNPPDVVALSAKHEVVFLPPPEE